MGAYTAFLDVALGFGHCGAADVMGLSAAFAASVLAALGSAIIAAVLLISIGSKRCARALASS